MKKILKWLLILSLAGIIVSAALIMWADYAVKRDSSAFLYSGDLVPEFKCGLLLGTVNKLGSDTDNPFFIKRIKAAAALYKTGKVKCLILSGDNSRKGYDEPEMMKQALLAEGVPDSAMYLDYAGFRTFDSVIRCYEIFGQQKFLVISQRFHNERAVFLARNKGLDAYGYDVEAVGGELGEAVLFREYLARVNAWLDLNILGTSPKYLGERIDIR